MRSLGAILLLCACARATPSTAGPAVRLDAGVSDTIVVNSRRPTPLRVRAIDANGNTVSGAPIRYQRVGIAPLQLNDAGEVTCTQAGDAAVRATLGALAAELVVRCRPVTHVRIPGPVQFILDDSAMSRPQVMPIEAYAADGSGVTQVVIAAHVADSGVATLRGLTLHPRSRGITIASAHVGDASAAIGVHVYQRAGALHALDTLLRVQPAQRLFAVPLRLQSGEYQRQHLPTGEWMLAMLPEEDRDPKGIRLRVEGAVCHPNLLNAPRRFSCRAGPGAAVVVYRPVGGEPSVASGYLLVRWLFQ